MNKAKITDEVFDAIVTIKAFCGDRGSCDTCPFHQITNKRLCYFEAVTVPENWTAKVIDGKLYTAWISGQQTDAKCAE